MTHLTLTIRCQIFALKESGIKQKVIAEIVKKHSSTISKELKRNLHKDKYSAEEAHKIAISRRKASTKQQPKLTPNIIQLILEKLTNEQWSPEQISGWLQKELSIKISHERIYQHIWQDKKDGGKLYVHLRRRGKRYHKRSGVYAGRGCIPGRIDIDERPKIVEEKSRVGDFEIDTIVGSKHRGAILSIVDRKTKLTKLVLLKKATASAVAEALIKRLAPIKEHVLTITSDNGKEFAAHKIVAQTLDAGFFFAKPYHAWERGLNENTNGLVRQYFPKGSSFVKLSKRKLADVENKLNNRPRKLLNFTTPNKLFLELTFLSKKIAFDY